MGRTIHVDVVQHRSTGLLMAVSRDLPGLHVAGNSMDEIEEELPPVIKALVEAIEKRKVQVTNIERCRDEFERRYFTFAAEPVAA